MFRLFKKKEGNVLKAFMDGKVVSLQEVNDPTFSEEMIGKGVAIQPTQGQVFAPANGTIQSIFPTLHALTLLTDTGCEVLLHIGLDTVKMNGKGFVCKVKQGDVVKAGDLLLEVDLDQIQEAGFDTISMMVVCNWQKYSTFQTQTGKMVNDSDSVIEYKD